MTNCPKCNAVVKGWDLVCPSCGATLFKPEAPADERKRNVDLPDWEMSPKKPEPVRKPPPPRPDPRKPVPARPAGPPAAHRIEVPTLPRPPLSQDAPASQEPTEMLSIDEIQPVDKEAGPPLPAAQPPPPAAPPVALADIRPTAPTAPAMAEAPVPAPPASAPAPSTASPPVHEAAQGGLRHRSRQDTMPIARHEEEITQPRVKIPQAAATAAPAAEPVPEALRKADAKETLTIENYDPERLKRILAQAQAEAAVRAGRQKAVPISVIIALIAAVTIIGVALVIALLA